MSDSSKWDFAEVEHKPHCQLTGPEGVDGNVFSIIGRVTQVLKKAGMKDKADEFRNKAMSGDFDYYEILGRLVNYYVEVA